LVFVLPRRAVLRVPHLSFGLACLAFCIAWATTPPPDRPHLPAFTQDQPCLDDRTDLFIDSITGLKLYGARTAAQLYAERSERVACAGVRALPG